MDILYFAGLKEEEEIKNCYKNLAKKHHPDLGGCTETMKAINEQYEKALNGYYKDSGKSASEIEDLLKGHALFREALCNLLLLNGLEIEICGRWIWITGNTFPYKAQLKEAGCLWSSNKKAWYWRNAAYGRSRNRKEWNLNMIRAVYGHEKISSLPQRTALA